MKKLAVALLIPLVVFLLLYVWLWATADTEEPTSVTVVDADGKVIINACFRSGPSFRNWLRYKLGIISQP
jgi:hypothetical protein